MELRSCSGPLRARELGSALGFGLLVLACGSPATDAADPGLRGRVLSGEDLPVAGALVTAVDSSGVSVTVYTDADGGYHLPPPPGPVEAVEVRDPSGRMGRWAGPDVPGTLRLEAEGSEKLPPPASAWLARLPESQEKRFFLLNCTACHVWDERWISGEDGERSREEWEEATLRMTATFGPASGFPVISGSLAPERLAEWLHRRLDPGDPPGTSAVAGDAARRAPAVLHEYPVPDPDDLPHDLAVDLRGRVVITGMFTHRMYVLDPETGTMELVPIPRETANPRAIDIDERNDWWVVLGVPGEIAHRSAATGRWSFHPVETYPHSVALDEEGRVWYNGHFSRAPEIVGALDPSTGETREFTVPRAPDSEAPPDETTIPYGLRVAPDGSVWGTQLRGGKLVRIDPSDGSVRQWSLPTPDTGPRRPDVAPDGTVWIPTYAGGTLAAFDPSAERFREWPIPVPDALPYVVRVDPRRGTVWIGTAYADALFAFDPGSETFTAFPLPTRGALVRHLDVDERTGDVWAAYGASPGIPAEVLRLSRRDVESPR